MPGVKDSSAGVRRTWPAALLMSCITLDEPLPSLSLHALHVFSEGDPKLSDRMGEQARGKICISGVIDFCVLTALAFVGETISQILVIIWGGMTEDRCATPIILQ